MCAKRSVAGKERKENEREAGAHFIDLFYSIRNKGKGKNICRLHHQRAVDTLVLNKIHDISAELKGRNTGASACP